MKGKLKKSKIQKLKIITLKSPKTIYFKAHIQEVGTSHNLMLLNKQLEKKTIGNKILNNLKGMVIRK